MRSCSRIRKTPKFGIRIAERLQVRPMGPSGSADIPGCSVGCLRRQGFASPLNPVSTLRSYVAL
jgi:hypothetical protein